MNIENRLRYFESYLSIIEEIEIQSLYYLDVVLPAYRESVFEAKNRMSYFIEIHYDNFIAEIIGEMTTILSYFEKKTLLINEIKNEYMELMVEHGGYDFFDTRMQSFEAQLLKVYSFLEQLFSQIKQEILKLNPIFKGVLPCLN